MKKLVLAVMLLSTLFVGCSSKDSETEALKQEIDQLQAEVEKSRPSSTPEPQYAQTYETQTETSEESEEDENRSFYAGTQENYDVFASDYDAADWGGGDIIDPVEANGCPDCDSGNSPPDCINCDGTGKTGSDEPDENSMFSNSALWAATNSIVSSCMLCNGSGIGTCPTCYGTGSLDEEYIMQELLRKQRELEAAGQMLEGIQRQNDLNRELDEQYRIQQEIQYQQHLDNIRRQRDNYEAPSFGY